MKLLRLWFLIKILLISKNHYIGFIHIYKLPGKLFEITPIKNVFNSRSVENNRFILSNGYTEQFFGILRFSLAFFR
jgi:hypothetical protein